VDNRYSPAKVLDKTFLVTYQQTRESFWPDVLTLNSTLFILDRIWEFRFDYFSEPGTEFWNRIALCILETDIAIINRIGLDRNRQAKTLFKFANQIRTKFVEEEAKLNFERRLDEISFEQRIEPYRDVLKRVRDNRISHFSRVLAENLGENKRLGWDDAVASLKPAAKLIGELWSAVCLGHHFSLYPLEYHPDVTPGEGMDGRPDIVRILETLALNSHLVHMPEREPGFWPMFKRTLPQEILDQLNEYRKAKGLPPA